MSVQVTVSPRLQAKMKKLGELYGEKIEEKMVSLGSYAVAISPVHSGAFVESWSLRPIGSSGGRSRTSRPDPTPDKIGKREEAKGLIRDDAVKYSKEIAEKGGAVLVNRAPHANEVEAKYRTRARIRDRFF